MRLAHRIALHELAHRGVAHVFVVGAAQQVVQHAGAQGAIGDGHALDTQFVEHRAHDGQPTREHRHAIGLEAVQTQISGTTRLDHHCAEPVQRVARDAMLGQLVGFEQFSKRPRRARGADRFRPAAAAIGIGHDFDLASRRQLGLPERALVVFLRGKELDRRADATDVDAFQHLGRVARADDQLSRPAADIDHQAPRVSRRQQVRDTEVDQARLFASGDHLDREPQPRFCRSQQRLPVACHAKGIGGHCAHLASRKPAQAFAEAVKGLECTSLRLLVERLVPGEAGGETDRFAKSVQGVDLIAAHPADLEPKTVGAQIDGGERLPVGHAYERAPAGRGVRGGRGCTSGYDAKRAKNGSTAGGREENTGSLRPAA